MKEAKGIKASDMALPGVGQMDYALEMVKEWHKASKPIYIKCVLTSVHLDSIHFNKFTIIFKHFNLVQCL